METVDLNGTMVLFAGEGAPIASERDGMDLIGEAMGEGASLLAVPVSRLTGAFFELKTGLAGALAQKIVTYRMRLAILGDVSAEMAASKSFADWVREANAGRDIWFLPDRAALEAKLGA